MRLAGHCVRHSDEIAHQLVLWDPNRGRRSRGRPAATYVDVLRRDTRLDDTNEIRSVMMNRAVWRKLVMSLDLGVGRWCLVFMQICLVLCNFV